MRKLGLNSLRACGPRLYNRFHVRGDTRVTPYANIRLKTYAQLVTVWRVGFGKTAWSTSAEEPDTVRFRMLVGQGLASHTDEHIVRSEAGGFPHANSQETDRGQELVGRGCCRHGVDTVEDRGNDERQATKGCCWRGEGTHLERTAASDAQCLP